MIPELFRRINGTAARAARLSLVAGAIVLVTGCASTSRDKRQADVDDTVESVAQEVLDEKRNYVFEIDAPEHLVALIRQQTYLGRWQRRQDYDDDQFKGLVSRLPNEIRLILQSQGYFNSSSRTVDIDAGVRLVVNAGARTTVNRVTLEVVGAGEGLDKIRAFAAARWKLPEGAFFDTGLWQSSKRELIELLHQQGYLRARITKSQALINRPLTAASVELEIDSGERIGFGNISIVGIERYDEAIVRNLSPFEPGEPYTLDKLVQYQNRLRASGYFADVSVLPRLTELASNPAAETVNLDVKVTEQQSKRFAIGFGYSTDEGIRAQLGLEHRNVFNRSWQMESALMASTKLQRAFANIRSPLSRSNHFWGLGGRIEREDVEGQVSTRSNTYFGRGRRFGEIESFTSLSYQVERQLLEPSGRDTSQRALVLGYAWNLRRLDSPVDPRRGYTISAQLSGARKGLATDETFIRFHTRAMRFFPMPETSRWRHGTLIALGEIGLVNTDNPDEIPTENLFRTGGGRTVRGYRYLSLGVPEDGSVIGGRYLFVASLEYQHRMSDLYSLAAFVDVGDAADSRSAIDPKLGYGLGVRFRTPVGPINLDLAYGQEIERWRAHFSVGYAF